MDLTVYADALNNAGICYARLGLFDRAVAAQRQARRTPQERRPAAIRAGAWPARDDLPARGSRYREGLPHLQQALDGGVRGWSHGRCRALGGQPRRRARSSSASWTKPSASTTRRSASRRAAGRTTSCTTCCERRRSRQAAGSSTNAARLFDDALASGRRTIRASGGPPTRAWRSVAIAAGAHGTRPRIISTRRSRSWRRRDRI